MIFKYDPLVKTVNVIHESEQTVLDKIDHTNSKFRAPSTRKYECIYFFGEIDTSFDPECNCGTTTFGPVSGEPIHYEDCALIQAELV
jgi:hypothetical protein